jgi:hypothetical protein
MLRLLIASIGVLFSMATTAAIYPTPGTGVKWDLANLVTNSGGNVTFLNNEYFINAQVTISTNDTLEITTNEIVKFAPSVLLQVNGVLIINPPTGVLFTAVDQAAGYLGVRFDFSNGSIINKLTLEYAGSFRILNSSPQVNDCVFRYNNASTTNGNGTFALFEANPVINNCLFFQNRRAAISGGANIANAPKIFNCRFIQNNTMNLNVPQINLGSSGTDTTKIVGCEIIGASIMSGGIGFLPTGNVQALIKQNYIRGNRYGITLNGGSNINAMISYNRIDDNNIQNDPNLGGSGIAFSGGSSSSHQNTIVTGNVFTNNLWGITIFRQDAGGNPISGAMPNIGNLTNADTSDDGKNYFINNTNAGTPGIDLYNNSSDPIFAMGNFWYTSNLAQVEGKIFHQVDNPALGLVTYSSFIIPVKLVAFTAQGQQRNVLLNWQTAQENNSDFYLVEKSSDAIHFVTAARLAAAGNSSNPVYYSYTDLNAFTGSGILYYRLKITDRDGSFSYSPVVAVGMNADKSSSLLKFYPAIVSGTQPVNVEMISNKNQALQIQIIDAAGRLVSVSKQTIHTGYNKLDITLPPTAAKGWFSIRLAADGFNQSIRILKK